METNANAKVLYQAKEFDESLLTTIHGALPLFNLSAREREMLERTMKGAEGTVTWIARVSDEEFDFVVRGERRSETSGFRYAFTSWFPLYCIWGQPWQQDPIASRTSDPEAAKKGDWNAVRGCSRKRLMKIFKRHVLGEKKKKKQ